MGDDGTPQVGDSTEPAADPETLRVAWVQLNERSRWYSTQQWQAPLAYIVAASVMVGAIVGNNPDQSTMSAWTAGALVAAALGGAMVLFHLVMIDARNRQIIADMVTLETRLGIRAVLGHPGSVTTVWSVAIASPLRWMLAGFTLVCLAGAIVLCVEISRAAQTP
jgi:hypothetical protein